MSKKRSKACPGRQKIEGVIILKNLTQDSRVLFSKLRRHLGLEGNRKLQTPIEEGRGGSSRMC